MPPKPVAQSARFKVCPCCGHPWPGRNDFLNDPGVVLIGYQVNFEALELGFFYFNHDACGTTMAIYAEQFMDLYNGPYWKESLRGQPECSGFCLQREELRPCPVQCECASIREVIQIIRSWRRHE